MTLTIHWWFAPIIIILVAIFLFNSCKRSASRTSEIFLAAWIIGILAIVALFFDLVGHFLG